MAMLFEHAGQVHDTGSLGSCRLLQYKRHVHFVFPNSHDELAGSQPDYTISGHLQKFMFVRLIHNSRRFWSI
jgi:hypothetical protein